MANKLKKFKELLIDLLNEGKTPKELSLAITLGCLLGIFPILGVTTAISIVLGKFMRLNIPAILTANYAVFPVQIFMIYILVVTGETIFALDTRTDYDFFKNIMEESWAIIFETLGKSLATAVFSWVLFSTILFFPLYKLFLFFIVKIKKAKEI
ncbi:MAG: DUF2062 domain-containing protein [Bacteroidia bacterium]